MSEPTFNFLQPKILFLQTGRLIMQHAGHIDTPARSESANKKHQTQYSSRKIQNPAEQIKIHSILLIISEAEPAAMLRADSMFGEHDKNMAMGELGYFWVRLW